MRFFNFQVVIEKEAEDEGYHARSPTLPGCFSNGRTIEEARLNMREAVTQHVASRGDDTVALPSDYWDRVSSMMGKGIG